ncbi:hypothetical protein NDU88_009890 [Pleurodeles waltl]|uniref:Uncharacterized protein n=1 Tax=Pleurodeles waltl TaxID=8319 RepID=A0AAV7QYQ8_PLEWA|nr:hypothetical protein NDU88_009890 [Pleurodeles waltl]
MSFVVSVKKEPAPGYYSEEEYSESTPDELYLMSVSASSSLKVMEPWQKKQERSLAGDAKISTKDGTSVISDGFGCGGDEVGLASQVDRAGDFKASDKDLWLASREKQCPELC